MTNRIPQKAQPLELKVIGFEEEYAKKILEARGIEVRTKQCAFRNGVEGADSARVIRQKLIGNNIMEITISRFKTKV